MNKKIEKFCPKYSGQNFSNFFVHILGNATSSYFHSEISWPDLCRNQRTFYLIGQGKLHNCDVILWQTIFCLSGHVSYYAQKKIRQSTFFFPLLTWPNQIVERFGSPMRIEDKKTHILHLHLHSIPNTFHRNSARSLMCISLNSN